MEVELYCDCMLIFERNKCIRKGRECYLECVCLLKVVKVEKKKILKCIRKRAVGII